jgi:hypothetical protein
VHLYTDSYFALNILMFYVALIFLVLADERTCKVNVIYNTGDIIVYRFTLEPQCLVGSKILLRVPKPDDF